MAETVVQTSLSTGARGVPKDNISHVSTHLTATCWRHDLHCTTTREPANADAVSSAKHHVLNQDAVGGYAHSATIQILAALDGNAVICAVIN